MVDNEVSKAFVETRMGSSPISCTIWHRSSVEQNAGLSRRRSRVQVPPVSPAAHLLVSSKWEGDKNDVLEVVLLKLIFERRLRGAHGSFQSPNP